MGSRTTSTSTIACCLISRRRAGSCYLIFSGGAVRTSRPATLTRQTIKSVTSTPSSPNWGSGKVVLVAHDASGPPAIDWALAHPERVAGLVLLNTYYCEMPTLRPPEAIWLFSTPVIRSVARPVSRMFGNWLFRRMYWWQVGRFIRDADVRREFVPLLYQQFDATPSARPAFFRLNEDLLPMVRSRTQMIPKLREFRRPVRIIFGDADPSLNSGVARTFHEFLPGSELFLIPGARHFVQLDEPEQVARLILAMPKEGSKQS